MDSLVIFLAKYLIVFVVLIVLVAWQKISNTNRKELAIAFLLAGITAAILSKLAGWLYFHPRPFVVNHVQPLIAHGNDNGFPSEHTVLAMTLTALVYYYNKRLALLALILTLLVGAGRVWAHVHSSVDIAGGLLIGAAAGSISYMAAKSLLARRLQDNSKASKT